MKIGNFGNASEISLLTVLIRASLITATYSLDLIMPPNCCKYFVNSRTPNRKNKRPATPANTATGIFAALIRLMKSELTEIKTEMQEND